MFLPTRPLRDATVHVSISFLLELVSTHASLAGRDGRIAGICAMLTVSTHASLAGRDIMGAEPTKSGLVSTHASLAGRDFRRGYAAHAARSFYPRVPCGTRRGYNSETSVPQNVSTHASLAGRDASSCSSNFQIWRFYPRVPCGTRPYSLNHPPY